MWKWTLILLVLVCGCKKIDAVMNSRLFVDEPLDPEMESFVRRAANRSGTELGKIDQDDPNAYAWDDVPLSELPDYQRAGKEMQRAKRFSAEVTVDGSPWNVSYRRYGQAWMLNNISTALINPKTEILFATVNSGKLSNVSSHRVFKHFIPPEHETAKKAHDKIRKRMLDR